MADPELRKLLEYARPVREFSQAIQTSLRMIEAAISAEATLDNLKARAEAATKEVEAIEARRSHLADGIAAERETLLLPARADLAKLEVASETLRQMITKERAAFDEERGRRTSILRNLDDQAGDVRRQNAQELKDIREAMVAEKRDLAKEISELKAQAIGAADDLAKLRGDYRAVQEAAAKLVGR